MIVGYWIRGRHQSHTHALRVSATHKPQPVCGCDVSKFDEQCREVVDDGVRYLDCGNCLRITRASIRRQQTRLEHELQQVQGRIDGKGGVQVDAFEE